MMMQKQIGMLLGEKRKRAIKAVINGWKARLAHAFFAYDGERLKSVLKQMGVVETDTLLVHANFQLDSGFQGTPADLVNVLVDLLGTSGNLMMVSIPFRGAAYDYLLQNKTFHTRKTVSMMGLVTEMFRRRTGTARSLHPTHPVLAYGKDSAEITAGHEACLYPCGPGSPFDKLLKLKGKILFFDVGFGAITFFHFVEDLLKEKLPFPVYEDRIFSVPVIDSKEDRHEVRTYAFTKGIARDTAKLEQEMIRQRKLISGRVGNSRLILVTAEDIVSVMAGMVNEGNLPYGAIGRV